MSDSQEGPKTSDAKTLRDEIRPKVEADVAAAIQDAKNRVKPAAQPRVQGYCSMCFGSGMCRACNGAGCGYCHGGACASCPR